MRYEELLTLAPKLRDYAEAIPQQIEGRFTLQKFPAHFIIHLKDSQLSRIGILLTGKFRVLNEFENGNIFMIEMNEPISFVGEVTLLAEADSTSVTIETVTACQIAFLPMADFDLWLRTDICFLRAVSGHVAQKLYCSSYNRGERLFYSSSYLLLKFIIGEAEKTGLSQGRDYVLSKTRALMSEEVGMTLKTLNRTVNTLREDGTLAIHRGKIVLSQEQFEAGKKRLAYYIHQSKNGSAGK